MKELLKKNIGYIIVVVVVFVGFQIQSNNRHEARRNNCVAFREMKLLLADMLNAFVPSTTTPISPNLSPELQELIEQSQQAVRKARSRVEVRLNKPIELCKSSDVNTRIKLSEGGSAVIRYVTSPPTIIVSVSERGG